MVVLVLLPCNISPEIDLCLKILMHEHFVVFLHCGKKATKVDHATVKTLLNNLQFSE